MRHKIQKYLEKIGWISFPFIDPVDRFLYRLYLRGTINYQWHYKYFTIMKHFYFRKNK